MLGQLDRALEPVGVGHQADLDEHAFERHVVQRVGCAVFVNQAIDLLAVAGDLGRLGVGKHRHVGQAVQFALQHGISPQRGVELNQRHMADQAGQVNGCFNTRVAAANHGHALTLEQRAVAMRAVSHALVLVFVLAGHVDIAPARAGRQDDGLAFQRGTAFELDFDQALARCSRRDQGFGALQVHDVHLVGAHMLLQRKGELRPRRFLHGDEVFNAHRVQHLAAETLAGDAGANAFAGGVNRRRRTGRAAANDQHVKGFLGGDFFRLARHPAGVNLRQDFLQAHAALGELGAVQVDRWHGHDLAFLDLILEQRAVNHRGLDARVLHCHQVQRLHHVGAGVARQRDIDFKVKIAVECADLLQHFFFDLRRVAANLQQRQNQRGKFMAHRQAGKTRAVVFAGAVDGKRRLAVNVVPAFADGDQR